MTSAPREAVSRCCGPSSSSKTTASSLSFSSPSLPRPTRFAWRVHPLNVALTNVLLAALRVVQYLIVSLSILSRQEAHLLHALIFLALVIFMHLISPSKRLPSLLLFTAILILYSTMQIQSAVLNESPFVLWYHTGDSNLSTAPSSPASSPTVGNDTSLQGTFRRTLCSGFLCVLSCCAFCYCLFQFTSLWPTWCENFLAPLFFPTPLFAVLCMLCIPLLSLHYLRCQSSCVE